MFTLDFDRTQPWTSAVQLECDLPNPFATGHCRSRREQCVADRRPRLSVDAQIDGERRDGAYRDNLHAKIGTLTLVG
jgi:hypothetical protein